MIVAIFVGLLLAVIAFYKHRYQYWRRKNVPYFEPSIPFGTSSNPFTRKEQFGYIIKRQYNEAKSRGWKHCGLFWMLSPSYLLVDLEYVKNIVTKDFAYFVDRGFYYNERHDPLSAHLFAIGGAKWRNLRTKLTPTFTSGKMKMMFQTLVDCMPTLLERIDSNFQMKQAIDIKELLSCFTTDIIGSCAFGLDCKTFQDDNSPFRKYGKKVFETRVMNIVRGLFVTNFPSLSKSLGVRFFQKEVTNFFMKVVKDTVNYRENNNVTRKDFMQILIDLKNNKLNDESVVKTDESSITIEEIAAQCFVFFLAGFETSSTTMTFALYELSKHPDLQEKVREEINTVLKNYEGKITYEAIQELKYMNQVINETLRKYPPLSFITRKCVKDYRVPDADVIIEKGTRVIIPTLAIHYDPEYYPNPEQFDPERFNDQSKNTRKNYTHIPFGEGPRICIGMRFGIMQSKVGLAGLLQKYKYSVHQKTKEPLEMKKTFVLAAKGEIWLTAEKV